VRACAGACMRVVIRSSQRSSLFYEGADFFSRKTITAHIYPEQKMKISIRIRGSKTAIQEVQLDEKYDYFVVDNSSNEINIRDIVSQSMKVDPVHVDRRPYSYLVDNFYAGMNVELKKLFESLLSLIKAKRTKFSQKDLANFASFISPIVKNASEKSLIDQVKLTLTSGISIIQKIDKGADSSIDIVIFEIQNSLDRIASTIPVKVAYSSKQFLECDT